MQGGRRAGQVEESVNRPAEDAARVAGRTGCQRVQMLTAATVDDVTDAVARSETLVVVVVARQHEIDSVLLEEGHPVPDDGGVAPVRPARPRGVVVDDDLPQRRGAGE